jgi:hypothetical protein
LSVPTRRVCMLRSPASALFPYRQSLWEVPALSQPLRSKLLPPTKAVRCVVRGRVRVEPVGDPVGTGGRPVPVLRSR